MGEIVSPLISFNLYDESLNGQKHTNHLLKAIKSEMNGANLEPSGWVVATQDGCAVNGAAIDHINNKSGHSVCKDTCVSHALCLCGKLFDTPNLDKFRG
eukprot:11447481-Ditylum_brightwellii.AAC.1